MTGTVSCSPECTWLVQHIDMRESWSFRTVKQLFTGSWSSFAVKHCLQESEAQKQKYWLGREFCSMTLWDSKSLGRRQFLWASNFCEQVGHRYDKNILICFPFFLLIRFPFLLLLWLLFLQLNFLQLHTSYSLVYFSPFSTFSFSLFSFSVFFCLFSFNVCSFAFKPPVSSLRSLQFFYLSYRQQIS
jgi:hypothetical protein